MLSPCPLEDNLLESLHEGKASAWSLRGSTSGFMALVYLFERRSEAVLHPEVSPLYIGLFLERRSKPPCQGLVYVQQEEEDYVQQ